MKIRAAVLEEFGQPLVVQEVDLAEPKDREVLVRLAACGVCHTDLYTASGADPSGYAPCVLGHEGAGVVERIGPGDQHREGVPSVASGPARLLPKGGQRAGKADRQHRVHAGDVDAQFQRVGAGHAAQPSRRQRRLEFAPVVGEVAGPVGRDAGGLAAVRPRLVGDQFGLRQNVQVGKPRFFCPPVEKEVAGQPPKPIQNAVDHLAVYDLPPQVQTVSIETKDQFGGHTLDVLESVLLIVPTEKQVVVAHQN